MLETMRYAWIAESPEEFNKYTARVLWNFGMLHQLFLEERDEILSGSSLKSLIRKRMDKKRKETQRLQRLQQELEAFRDGQRALSRILRQIWRSDIRGELLGLLLKILEEKAGETGKARLSELQKACQEHGLL